jgi:hypothetical protein
MAELEAEAGAVATYFLMTRSVFYNLASAEGERAVARLRELGHRVGHHAVYPHIDLDKRFERGHRVAQPRSRVHAGAAHRRGQRHGRAVVLARPLPVGLEPALALGLPARSAPARDFECSSC